MKILVATTNQGKIAELNAMVTGLHTQIEWVSLKDFPDVPEVVEDGLTFAENARKKALGYAGATGLWTIADDSGLVIDALDGAPGVKSARFSGEKNEDEDRTLIDHNNIKKVLRLMQGIPTDKRAARFVCSLCLATPEKVLAQTEGKLEGTLATRQIGAGGFGYDPIMYIPSLGKTAAQLSHAEKNNISHRGNALRKLKPLLTALSNKRPANP